VSVRIRRYSESDLAAVADVHAEAFTRQLDAKAWITEKSGFRQDAALELEQIAVAPPYRKRRIGERLVVQSLPEVAKQLAARCGAEIEARLPSLYLADEVLMVARNPLPR
jgi:GNAT superfamily N-acetyltransferase